MSFSEVFASVKSESNSNNYYIQDGINVFRIVATPIVISEAFVEYTVENKESGKKEVKTRSEYVYDGCSYAAGGKTKFVMQIIDSGDQVDEDGTPKIKIFTAGWKIMEGLVNKENMREAQGLGKFSFPMELDTIVNKTGSGQFNTNYGTDVMLDPSKNKVQFSLEQIKNKLINTPTLIEWKEELEKSTKERHQKYGSPRLKEEKKKGGNQEDVPTIQYDDVPFPSEEELANNQIEPGVF